MVVDPINSWDKDKPAGTDYIDASDELIRANNAAVENMVDPTAIENLVITVPGSTGDNSIDVSYDVLGMRKNTGTPIIPFTDFSASFTIDMDTGAAMDGYETGMSTAAGWKYIYSYRDDTNGDTKGLLAASKAIGSVTEPDANYRFGRMIGVAYWDGVSAFTAFKQYDKEVSLNALNQVVTNGRSDAAWSGAVSLATVVPDLAKFASVLLETAVGTGGTLLQVAANSSGNHPRIIRINNASLHSQSSRMILLTQNLHYWTEESGGIMQADVYIAGYEMAI